MVKVYSLSTCPWCKKVKQLLDDNKVEYTAQDVDLMAGQEQQDAVAEVEKLTGKRSFPVTIINEKVIAGFKEDEILEEIKKSETEDILSHMPGELYLQ